MDLNTGQGLSTCNLMDTFCIPKCYCNTEFFGSDCSLTLTTVQEVQLAQNNVLSQLAKVTSTDVSKDILIMAMSSTVNLLSFSNKEDLLPSSISLSSDIIESTMTSATSLQLSIANITVYNDVISSFISLSASPDTSSTTKTDIQTMYESYVSAIGTQSLTDPSKTNMTITTSNLQIVVTTVRPVSTISSLSTQPPHEILWSSNRRLLQGQSVPLLISVTRGSLYSTSDPFINTNTNVSTFSSLNASTTTYSMISSNPLRIQLDCSLVNQTDIKIVIQNYARQVYTPIIPITKPITTVCYAYQNTTNHTYPCQYSDGSIYFISVPCDGTKNATYITKCPVRSRTPVCNIMSDFGSCTLLDFNEDQLICSCSLCSSSRRLTTISSVAYQVSSMVEFVYDDYISKMTDITTLNGNSYINISLLFNYIYLTISIHI